MKTYPHNVTVTTVEEAVNWLIKANNSNTDILKSVVKTNNRLVFAVLVLGFGGYLACNLFKKYNARFNELEKTVNTLVQIQVGTPPAENSEPAGE